MAEASDSLMGVTEFQKLNLAGMTSSVTRYMPTYDTDNGSRALDVVSVENSIQNVPMIQHQLTDEHQSLDMVDALHQNQQDLKVTEDLQIPLGIASLSIMQSTGTILKIQQEAVNDSLAASRQSVMQLMSEVNAHSVSFTPIVPARKKASSRTTMELQPLSVDKKRELQNEHQVVVMESRNDITPVRESASRGNEITTSPRPSDITGIISSPVAPNGNDISPVTTSNKITTPRYSQAAENNLQAMTDSVTARIPDLNIQYEVQLDNCTIYATKQDLTGFTADVIVNPVRRSMKLVAGFALALHNKGGPQIQAECSQHVENRGCLLTGEIYTSTAGSLPCSRIIHVVSPTWNNGTSSEGDQLYKAVMTVLKKAASMRFNSLAMPALSAGGARFPVAVSLRNILKAVKDFFESYDNVMLQNIHLVDINPKVLLNMRDALVKTFGESRVQNSILTNQNLNKSISYQIYAFGQDRIDKGTKALKDAYRQHGIVCQNANVPSNWDPMHATATCHVKLLAPANVDYQTVAAEFNTATGDKYVIVKMELIQNLALYTKVQRHKEQVKNRKTWKPDEFCCMDLWHESEQDHVNKINAKGFDKQEFNNYGEYGNGVYFYKNLHDSNLPASLSNTAQPRSTRALRHVYRCTVLTGEFTQGQKEMSDPPVKDPSNPGDMYDSVVDNAKNPGLFVIFRGTQAYPDYLVTFKEK